ncbi:MAG: hypothetical protein Q9M40_00455 [Sulfurimonas sp.]|nr:hypothetical protein [Sulfurimonas sp.]
MHSLTKEMYTQVLAKEDGTYSDARVLTPLELMILTSLPADWNIPKETTRDTY